METPIRFSEKFSRIKNDVKLFWNKIKPYFIETPEKTNKRIKKILDKIREDYPEIISDEKIRNIVRTYHEIKNIERQKIYYVVLGIMTLTTVLVGWQNLQIQKQGLQLEQPLILPVVGTYNCPQADYYSGESIFHFTFSNAGKSAGYMGIQLNSTYSDLSLQPNITGITLSPNAPLSLTLTATPKHAVNNYNFSIIVTTSDNRCLTKICSYNKTFSVFNKVLDSGWNIC